MFCTDQATTFLKSKNYDVIRHPSAEISPLDIIARSQGAASIAGTLTEAISSSTEEAPAISRNITAADFEGTVSSKLDLVVGVKILDSILAALGANEVMGNGYPFMNALLSDSIHPGVGVEQFDAALAQIGVALVAGDQLLAGRARARPARAVAR